MCDSPDASMTGDWMREQTVPVIGVPWDEKSSFMRGCADAPSAIWNAFNCGSANTCAEDGHDLGRDPRFVFRGNMQLSTGNRVIDEIADQAAAVIAQGALPLFLGGDHAVTYPLVRAMAEAHDGLNILHFDAHPDLYDEFEGDRYFHGSPFARIMEGGRVRRLVSVGIRTLNPHQQAQAERFGVEIVDMRRFHRDMTWRFDGPLYLSLDLDVLDPAFVPGISHYEPGGLTTRELIHTIQALQGAIVGADIVEYNPHRDIQNMTALTAATLMKEIAVKML
jgi:agmatinase